MAASAPSAKRAKLDFSKHFRVLVGEEQKEFIVHKDPISLRSTFFTAAASETWNAAGKPIELQEYTPNVFSDYLKCVYTNAVNIDDGKEVYIQEINHAISIYVLADYLGDCKSMNLVIDSIIQWRTRNNFNPPPVCIRHLYNCTSAESRLRRLFVDFHIHLNAPGWFEAFFKSNLRGFNPLVQLPEFCSETLIEFARLSNEDLKEPVWKNTFIDSSENKLDTRHNERPSAASEAAQVRDDFTEHLRVLVGEEKQEFMVHKDLVITRSPFFKAAVAERWNTDPAKGIELPDDKPTVFASYLQCLYLGTVHTEEDEEEVYNIYILADKLGDLTSANVVMDFIVKWHTTDNVVPSMESVGYAFQHTAATSKLRQVLVAYWVHEAGNEYFQKGINRAVKHGFTDVCGALLKEYGRLKAEGWANGVSTTFAMLVAERPTCYYHQHDETLPPCTST
ncbi:hypothetical protein LTR56_010756 [Elasticomyces elasticus]|nr:hypothetical protein LTR56_010756 [Elasticomyces elasticus]KAK3667781.1 hypothetical protein LTR22_001226 [Elasticomyces elasticus]KAK4932226.1 hypothetical protein LTR49_001523 [Elasticomyces elasticus]KAK5763394.1 hypothetical protein LTS12_006365 [Elasticomyces elasticus]